MRIVNNMMAMNTHRQYQIANEGTSGSAEKLASGYRINRAADDAAGLAISEKMRAQIRGLNMASKNSQDGISLIQTAEGALQESHNVLQRMRELAVQSASDTNEQGIDRNALEAEFQELMKEIDDTASKTTFNNMGVIDGTFAATETFYADSTTLPTGFTVAIEPQSANALYTTAPDELTFTVKFTSDLLVINDGTADIAMIASSKLDNGSTKAVFANGVVLTFESLPADLDLSTNHAEVATLWGLTAANNSFTLSKVKGDTMTLQTGANKGDELDINIERMDSGALGMAHASVAFRTDASNAIESVNAAINKVSTQRGKLGALQNRLSHKIANLDTSAENLQASESRIRDIDMAKEMSNFTKQNILVQASTAMLAQANSAPQNILSLLR